MADVHDSVMLVPTFDAPLAGFGFDGRAGGGGAGAAVVNDQTGPVASPALLCATICQKYVVLLASVAGVNVALDCPVETCGGGLLAPNLTS